MKKVFKAPIILSLLAASAFSIIGQEPARAGNKYLRTVGKCRVMKVGKGDFRIKRNDNLVWKGTSFIGAESAMRSNNGQLARTACDWSGDAYKAWGSQCKNCD